MTAIEDIRDIFSILHDGTISAWTGDQNLLTLTVDCEYLAERIDKSFDKFYVELINVDKLELDPWTNPIDLPTIVKTNYADIFKAELEILSAEIKEKVVVITCNQHDTSFDYFGGNLILSCRAIKVYEKQNSYFTDVNCTNCFGKFLTLEPNKSLNYRIDLSKQYLIEKALKEPKSKYRFSLHFDTIDLLKYSAFRKCYAENFTSEKIVYKTK